MHYAKMLQPGGAAIQGGQREGNNQFSLSLIIHMNHFLNIFSIAKLGPRDSITQKTHLNKLLIEESTLKS